MTVALRRARGNVKGCGVVGRAVPPGASVKGEVAPRAPACRCAASLRPFPAAAQSFLQVEDLIFQFSLLRRCFVSLPLIDDKSNSQRQKSPWRSALPLSCTGSHAGRASQQPASSAHTHASLRECTCLQTKRISPSLRRATVPSFHSGLTNPCCAVRMRASKATSGGSAGHAHEYLQEHAY